MGKNSSAQLQRLRDRYNDNRAAGICVKCRVRAAREGARMCFPCALKENEYQHRIYERRKAAGQCHCGRQLDLEGRKCCSHCAEKQIRKREERKNEQRKESELGR